MFRRGCPRANIEKILKYLPTYHSKSLVQRAAFVLEAFGCKFSADQEALLQSWSKGNSAYLFTRHKMGSDSNQNYSSKWRLVINAPGFLPQKADSEIV